MKSEWKKCKIGDVCDSVSITYSRQDDYVVLINTSDVLNGKILNHTTVKNKNLRGQFKKTFQKEDILYSEIRPANRRFAFVDFVDTQNYIASTKLMVIRPRQEKILPEFLFLILTNFELITELQHLAETRSGTFPQITFSQEVAPISIKLPPLPTQKKIAVVLSALDAKIENNNAINRNLEQQAQALFKSWFVDFEPFGGKMPEGWREEELGNLHFVITDYVSNGSFASLKDNVKLYSTPNYAYFIRNTDLKDGIYRVYVDEHSYNFLSKSVLVGGEIIISNVGDVGSVYLCPILDKPMTLGNNIIVLKQYPVFWRNYLYILFKWSYGKELIKGITGGSAQPKFNKTDFKSLKILRPTDKDLKRFDVIASPIFSKTLENRNENTRLTALRDTLLPKLMSGEIEV